MNYNFISIEAKWQKYWAENQTFKAASPSPSKGGGQKRPFYCLDMFPYPSGAGLHVGHPLGYIASDIVSRYKRHKGFNVLHPMGYDSFGLPAEQYAIQTGQHPAVTTKENIARYRQQMDKIGFSFDWSREVRTSDPEYYKWTQWIFIKLFESWYDKNQDKARDIEELIAVFSSEGNANVNAVCDEKTEIFTAEKWNNFSEEKQQEILLKYRLTYLAETEVNWCPALGTVLANDEIVNGVSERGGYPVERKKMKQWSMRISAYAERLLQGLEKIDWTESLKETQRNWIGKSVGASVVFKVLPPTPSKGGGAGKRLTGKSDIIGTLLDRAKKMRKNPTKAEAALWNELRNKKIGNKFRQQHPIDKYIADFVCLSKKLIIEIDGEIHQYQLDKDLERELLLKEKKGFKVLRFTNNEVLNNRFEVLSKIKKTLNELPFDVHYRKSKENMSEHVLPSGEDLGGDEIDVFTTRPDTIFGVTFMNLAPEHELVSKITTPEQKEAVEAYIKQTAKRSERERMADVKSITGVFTGAFAEHPFTKEAIPIWIGDYVLAGYGTGAVMAVPCGDQRDYDFAKHFDLPIKNIFEGVDISEEAYTGKEVETKLTNSDFLNGLNYEQAMKKVIAALEEIGQGTGKTNYRLRDAVFSRQRYWGEPFPVYYKNGIPHTIPEECLPLKLPEVEKYLPTETGEPPLGRAEKWHWDEINQKVVSKKAGTSSAVETYPLELNTMPGWAGSSWYFFRYMEPAISDGGKRDEVFASKEALNYWKNVDLYIGGSEHGTGHLLYARFWTKFLKDRNLVPVDEPFQKLINQGMILGESAFVFRIEGENKFVSKNLIEEKNVQSIHTDVSFVNIHNELDIEAFKNWRPEFKDAEFILENGELYDSNSFPLGRPGGDFIVHRESEKMSKSKYNVVNPDDICEEYGADSLRMYEMFLGPLEQAKPWNTAGITGVHNFLKKLWKLYHSGPNGEFLVNDLPPSGGTEGGLKILHKTIKKVTEDIENFSFNTSISALMICVNELSAQKCTSREVLEPLAVLIAPFAPHIAEELWKKLGHSESISTAAFPIYEEKFVVENTKKYPISFNGKVKFTLELSLGLSKEEIEESVISNERTQKQLDGRNPKKVIVVPGKIVNIVV
ncbi:MAG TPA: DUF559 domain-containing protein [Flavobacteriaceae bacterium]|nr:DUF559 domain-containing protein [Flavobacteriaceae bacterium]